MNIRYSLTLHINPSFTACQVFFIPYNNHVSKSPENTLKIFVGARVDGQGQITHADSPELAFLGQKALENNYFLGQSIDDALALTFAQARGKNVIIKGGLAGVCVAAVAIRALQSGARQVSLDLNKIRTDSNDHHSLNKLPKTRKARLLGLQTGLGTFRNDKRLKIR